MEQERSQLLDARVTETESHSLSVHEFMEQPSTPGNVGVCLSGGGSRAMTAGMGQLRGLKYLKTANGKSLLEQTKALSTVSGGSWVGTTFEFLPPQVSDDDYLNQYVPDQSKLKPTKGASIAESLDQLPEGNIGQQITKHFNAVSLAFEAISLAIHDVEPSMIWQTLVGEHILKPYGLYNPDKHHLPTSSFTSSKSNEERIKQRNSSISEEDFHLLADELSDTKVRRPYLACNFSMFVKVENDPFEYLVPVQSTPFMTGVVGNPDCADNNGNKPGGGGVGSFSFNSVLNEVHEDRVTVNQARQFSLADCIGTSSSFFAELLENTFAKWLEKPDHFLKDLQSYGKEGIRHLRTIDPEKKENLFERIFHKVETGFEKLEADILKGIESFLKELDITYEEFENELKKLQDLIPQYLYWPIKHAVPNPDIKPNRFADGGNLENTGINALLSYNDIDKVISFVNSDRRLSVAKTGAFDTNGNEIPGTAIVISGQIPPLFGYQPHDEKRGYRLYEGDKDPSYPQYRHNQVFESSAFSNFLQELAKATGKDLNTGGANVKMKLKVLPNQWFGVDGNREVELLLVYTNRIKEWYDELAPDVQAILGDFNDPNSYASFPHYSTTKKTELSPTEINLMGNLTAWNIANDKNAPLFIDMYSD